ncbi:SOS response-associated peptidase [Bordetella sp. 02P26C-1]|uniref:SOS response-associated peptidase n=1 Tax=Bordetella sp. 02P26C-1 TaxID=2683195 RepID=UPI001353AAFE|nr:SOS response-associated peptidase family protein [Bordetella sp. 02P26C-1]MVW80660.1 SOS response-associated peptidase [Bordetella sp. 02P26C-1]
MCSHYQGIKKREQMEKYFRSRGLPLPPGADMWPRRLGEFIRRPPEWDSGDEAVPERETELGRWGLISAMTRADNLPRAEKLSTFNARSETAHKSFTFSHAWRKGQRCIIPAEAIYEPDWRTGKAISTRFTRADGAPLGIAGLWDQYKDASGNWRLSYTMLTINADHHPLFQRYHRPNDEKRMVVILPDESYTGWLNATLQDMPLFLQPYPADALIAAPVAKQDEQARDE